MNPQAIISSYILILVLQGSYTKSVKSIARPVHEIVNEQSRVDHEKPRLYGNPLSGNPQIARQHALHQQAMFNAERDRQHRAQLQRWTSAPQKIDSYMKAYHESQESHHLALENQQSKVKDVARDHRTNKPTTVTPAPQVKKIQRPEIPKRIKVDSTRITKSDAVRSKQDKNRSHRSYGSDYYAHLVKQNAHLNPSRYYEGVTIKPNGNIGLSADYAQSHEGQSSNLYTEFIPSKTQYVYPKHHNQMKGYQSAQDIASLSSLLQKPAQDQLSELNALIQASKPTSVTDASDIHKPIDLFFYLKDAPSSQTLVEPYEETKYVDLPQTYAQEYASEHQVEIPKDHTPITEEVDDIADPNKPNKLTSYGIQPVLTSQAQILQEIEPETTTTKSNNYYKVEVASQTISSGYKPSYYTQAKQPIEYVPQHQTAEGDDEYSPTYQTLHYGQQPVYYSKDEATDTGDHSESYLHHNAQHKGIQHLTEDGTGISAYDDDSHNLHYAANYEFGYRVRDHHSGNYFGHHEAKQGEKTNGHYHVLLPDGRMQKVKYWAGPSGFHADISYDHLQSNQEE